MKPLLRRPYSAVEGVKLQLPRLEARTLSLRPCRCLTGHLHECPQ